MSLDITIKRVHDIKCPDCGKTVRSETVDVVGSGGRYWYPFLEKVGYYVPHEKRPKDYKDVWYGENMRLTEEQTLALLKSVKDSFQAARDIRCLVSGAIAHDDAVVINADW